MRLIIVSFGTKTQAGSNAGKARSTRADGCAVQADIETAALQAGLERRFKDVLGVRLIVRLVERGKTDEYTATSKTSKIKRLLDRRGSA